LENEILKKPAEPEIEKKTPTSMETLPSNNPTSVQEAIVDKVVSEENT
jgi:hypothetical protein